MARRTHVTKATESTSVEEAVAEYGDAIYRLALSQTRNQQDAQDVAQETFLAFYKSGFIPLSAEHLKRWLLRTCSNKCIDLARKNNLRRTMPLEECRQLADDSSATAIEDTAVWEAVGKLPKEQMLSVHLHYVEGYSTDEIAKIAGCRPGTVRSQLSRAREFVKRELADRNREQE